MHWSPKPQFWILSIKELKDDEGENDIFYCKDIAESSVKEIKKKKIEFYQLL